MEASTWLLKAKKSAPLEAAAEAALLEELPAEANDNISWAIWLTAVFDELPPAENDNDELPPAKNAADELPLEENDADELPPDEKEKLWKLILNIYFL